MIKSILLVMLHGLCFWAEYVLWHKPLDMPVPVLICAIGLVWLVVIVLSYHHARHIAAWLCAPPLDDIAKIIQEDERRRQLEMQRMLVANPWVDQ